MVLDSFCRDASYKEIGESLKAESRKRIYRALTKASMSSQEIADYLGIKRSSVCGRLSELMGGSNRQFPVLVEVIGHKQDPETHVLVSVYSVKWGCE